MNGIRQFYLKMLQSDELNNRFGGPLFVAMLVATSLFLAATWIRSDIGLLEFGDSPAVAQHEDFAAFYRGGQMAAEGRAAEVYDYRRFVEGLSGDNQSLLFLNPPHALLFYELLAKTPYPAARGLVLGLSVLCLFLSVRLIRLQAGFWPYVFVAFSAGTLYSLQLLQLSPITTFLLLFALLFSRQKPVLSGLALCVLTIKPQYGLLVPVYLLAMRDWRAFGVAACGTLVLVALSIGVYGVSVWQAFFASMTGGVHSIQFQISHNMMVTFGQSMGKIGAGADLKMIAQIICIVVSGVVVWVVARHWRREAAAPLSLLAMSVAAPSFLFYDWLMYAMALLLMLKLAPAWPLSLQALAGLLWIAPVVHDVLNVYDAGAAFYFSSLIPAIAVAVLAHAAATFSRQESACGRYRTPHERPGELPV
ncbi:glycosyltransferase family 87 protein [Roseibium sp. AS2]|uniref:glycosyltransferase family 87 protein n=1 Tax=Roseibium sp. AS2 TaxID=3135781 RepID=UPI00318112B0